jgi:hypothetical protein
MSVAEAVAVGEELPALTKEPTQRRIDVFSGVKPRSTPMKTGPGRRGSAPRWRRG